MWVAELRMRGLGKRRRREDVAFRKLIEPVAPAKRGRRQREAPERLGLGTGAAVSAQLRRLKGLLDADQSLRRVMERVEQTLDTRRTPGGDNRRKRGR